MKTAGVAVLLLGAVALSGCETANYGEPEDYGPPPPAYDRPIGPGALVGTVAADRDGDGKVDGYYTPDGAYHPIRGYCPPPPPPPPPTRRGERG